MILFPNTLAPDDYEGLVRVLEFTGNGSQTVPISITDDTELEDIEFFTVNITTTDDYVEIIQRSTQVFIQDSGNGIDL